MRIPLPSSDLPAAASAWLVCSLRHRHRHAPPAGFSSRLQPAVFAPSAPAFSVFGGGGRCVQFPGAHVWRPAKRTGRCVLVTVGPRAPRAREKAEQVPPGTSRGSGQHRGPRGSVFSKMWTHLLSAQIQWPTLQRLDCPQACGVVIRPDARSWPRCFLRGFLTLSHVDMGTLCGPGWLDHQAAYTAPSSEGSVSPGGGGECSPASSHGLCPGEESPLSRWCPAWLRCLRAKMKLPSQQPGHYPPVVCC